MSEPPKRPLRYLDWTVEAVATAAFIVMFGATILQVVVRYVLFIPIPWTEELARILFSWSMLLGIAVAIRTRENIRVEALLARFGPRGRRVVELLFGLVILLLLLSLARGTITMLRVTWESYMISLDWLRTGYLYAGQLVAIILMIVYLLGDIAATTRDLVGRWSGRAEGAES